MLLEELGILKLEELALFGGFNYFGVSLLVDVRFVEND
jgi:hypothetical protein